MEIHGFYCSFSNVNEVNKQFGFLVILASSFVNDKETTKSGYKTKKSIDKPLMK